MPKSKFENERSALWAENLSTLRYKVSNTSAFSRKVLADRQDDFREESFGGSEGKSLPRSVKHVLVQEWMIVQENEKSK
ncbi:hypothetical protein [Rossellomorea vietnamensis]|uniref:hypothetical protein n=1 Tax=Rossellomorea vietnamensis TaxID=218284 RepID=UPI001E2B65C4|nr:hypothetical protein [Rossellomorea vietnamensis]MCC5804523.1 hypothetical protein [Rossellomorea vietnamensis]